MSKSGSTNPLRKEMQFSDLSITMTAHPITGNVNVKKMLTLLLPLKI